MTIVSGGLCVVYLNASIERSCSWESPGVPGCYIRFSVLLFCVATVFAFSYTVCLVVVDLIDDFRRCS